MSAPTKTDEVRKAVNAAIDQVRTPLLAALGAGNLAGQALADAVNRAKERGENARKNLEDLPSDVESLRGKLDPAELRKVVDEYTDAALKLYQKLAATGEQTWDTIASQPQVKKAIEQFEEVTSETRERVEDVLGKVTKKTRSVGEKTADTVERVAEETALTVEDLGGEVADEVRSTSRKAADRTAPKTPKTTETTGTSASGTSGTSGTSGRGSSTATASAAKKPAGTTTPKTQK